MRGERFLGTREIRVRAWTIAASRAEEGGNVGTGLAGAPAVEGSGTAREAFGIDGWWRR